MRVRFTVRFGVRVTPTFGVVKTTDVRVQETHVSVPSLPYMCVRVPPTHTRLTEYKKVIPLALLPAIVPPGA